MPVLRALALALGLALAASAPAGAQVLPTLPSAAPTSPFDIQQSGIYTTAPIVLDGSVLFRIAATGSATSSIAERVTVIESVLQQITSQIEVGDETETAYDPATFKVSAVRQNDEDVLEAIDGRHHQAVPIMTVTTTDAQYNLTTVDALAQSWQDTLQSALVKALIKRQPAQVRLNLQRVAIAAGVLLVLTLILGWIVSLLRGRSGALRETLEQRAATAGEATATPDAGAAQEAVHHSRRRLLAFALRRIAPEQRMRIYNAVADVLVWLVVLLWFVGVTWALARFPQTTATARWLWQGALGVAGIWIVAALVNRLLDVVIQRAASVWHVRYQATSEERARHSLRIPTVANAIAGFKTILIVFIAALASLSQVGLSIGSVVTIGGIAALGVSLAAQNLVRDIVNGFLVLFEDQYVVGDYVTINAQSGLVEHLTLRIAQIRDAGGNLITIPHSSVTTVSNHSRNWSRVDYVVSAAPDADPQAAMAAVRAAIESMAADPAWRDALIMPLEWIGIDSMTKDWIAIRAALRTAPLRQFAVRRELNDRVVREFRKANLGFGVAIADEYYP
ncbi:MAG TPA: mechanosensitive ion channel family protein [Candidatus Sulfotelmatobacter sp.]|nr:mechanosensitive ion channel family protein [Candidatus Sulfotelmatobacter sp.]